MSDRSKTSLLAIGAFYLFSVAFWVVSMIPMLEIASEQRMSRRCTRQVTATVTQSGFASSLTPYVIYEYTFEGRNYAGERGLGLGGSLMASRSKEELKAYQPGMEFEIRINPDNPEESIFEQSISNPLEALFFGVLFAFGGGLAFIGTILIRFRTIPAVLGTDRDLPMVYSTRNTRFHLAIASGLTVALTVSYITFAFWPNPSAALIGIAAGALVVWMGWIWSRKALRLRAYMVSDDLSSARFEFVMPIGRQENFNPQRIRVDLFCEREPGKGERGGEETIWSESHSLDIAETEDEGGRQLHGRISFAMTNVPNGQNETGTHDWRLRAVADIGISRSKCVFRCPLEARCSDS